MARKIMALVMAIALVVCFAVSASAIPEVIPTTTYVNGEASVVVNVTNAGENANVTYYATKNDAPVFVDQKQANAAGATSFEFVTALTNVGSTVKVGYTGSETAVTDEIDDVAKYTIKYGETEVGWVYVGETAKTVTFDYAAPAHHSLKSVSATNADAVGELGDGTITVTLTNIVGEVVITIETEDKEIDGYVAKISIADAAAIVVKEDAEDAKVKDENDEFVEDEEIIASVNADKAGDRKLTVCGKVESEYQKYGIIVSTDSIATENLREADFTAKYADDERYEAKTVAGGRFAVQLIDTSAEGDAASFVVKGTPYYVAVYAYSEADGVYFVVANADAISAN